MLFFLNFVFETYDAGIDIGKGLKVKKNVKFVGEFDINLIYTSRIINKGDENAFYDEVYELKNNNLCATMSTNKQYMLSPSSKYDLLKYANHSDKAQNKCRLECSKGGCFTLFIKNISDEEVLLFDYFGDDAITNTESLSIMIGNSLKVNEYGLDSEKISCMIPYYTNSCYKLTGTIDPIHIDKWIKECKAYIVGNTIALCAGESFKWSDDIEDSYEKNGYVLVEGNKFALSSTNNLNEDVSQLVTEQIWNLSRPLASQQLDCRRVLPAATLLGLLHNLDEGSKQCALRLLQLGKRQLCNIHSISSAMSPDKIPSYESFVYLFSTNANQEWQAFHIDQPLYPTTHVYRESPVTSVISSLSPEQYQLSICPSSHDIQIRHASYGYSSRYLNLHNINNHTSIDEERLVLQQFDSVVLAVNTIHRGGFVLGPLQQHVAKGYHVRCQAYIVQASDDVIADAVGVINDEFWDNNMHINIKNCKYIGLKEAGKAKKMDRKLYDERLKPSDFDYLECVYNYNV